MTNKIMQTIFGIFYSKSFYKNIVTNTEKKHYIISLSVIILLLVLIMFPKDLMAHHDRIRTTHFFKDMPSFNIDNGKLAFEKNIHFYQVELLTKHNPFIRFISLKNKSSILHSNAHVIFTEKNLYWKITHTFTIIFPYHSFYIQQINSKHILQAENVFFEVVLIFDFIKVFLLFFLLLWIAERIEFFAKKTNHNDKDYFMLSLLSFIPCCCYLFFLTYYPVRFDYQFIIVPLIFIIYFFNMRSIK